MALLATDRLGSVVLVDAVGVEVPGHPVADFFSLTFPQLAELSYHDPARFIIDPTALPPAGQTVLAANRASLAIYAGATMQDPTLRERLAAVQRPVAVICGRDDRIVDPVYGRAYAEAIPGARFTVIPDSGHLPQLETPAALAELIWSFADARAAGHRS